MEENIYEVDGSEMGITPQFVYEEDGQFYQADDMQMIIVQNDDITAEADVCVDAIPVETKQDPVYQFINMSDDQTNQMYYQISSNDETTTLVTTNSGAFIISQPLFINNQEETEVAGRNLLTGQVISVSEHLEKLEKKRATHHLKMATSQPSNETDPSINQKILLGLTPEGKKLYGKILKIEHGGLPSSSSLDEDEEDGDVAPDILRTVEMILTNLVCLESMKKRLSNKVLVVKLFLKESGYVGTVHGALVERDEEWSFVTFRRGVTGQVDVKCLVRFSNHVKLTLQLTKQSNSYSALRVSLSTVEKRNICIVCFSHFKTKRQLSQHYVTVHPGFCDVNPETFVCETCHRTFFNASSLKRHLVVHDDQLRTHKCDICNQLCTDVTTLKKHLLSHVDYKPHACELCGLSFTHQGDLNKHRTTHYFATSAQNYKCAICGQNVSRYSNLERHLKIHMNGNYSCHICGCSYQHTSSLTRHIVQSHVRTGVE